MARCRNIALPITKIQPPPRELGLLARPQLLERIAAARSVGITLLIAPAGSGKTTLLGEAYRQFAADGAVVTWLTLDRSERVARHFLDHLIGILQEPFPAVGHNALELIRDETLPLETVMGSLINDLVETAAPVVLFLDGFHEIETQEISRLLLYFLQYLPANVHIVLASQRHFPLSFSRARLRCRMIELGWDDLRFRREEARTYLLDVQGLDIADPQLSDLIALTEGWIGTLQMAADALRHTAQPLRLNDGDFADVLLEELFNRLPGDLQRFVSDTCILGRLSPPLCDAVTAGDESAQHLAELERDHFFARRLDAEGKWLRYHHLFAVFLRKRLLSSDPRRAAQLHRRAGDWHAAHQHVNEALNHWLAAGATEPAAALLAEHGQTLLRNAEVGELENWLRRLPRETISASVKLATLYAWCSFYSGRPLAIRIALEDAQRAAERQAESAASGLEGEWILLRALSGIISYDWFDNAEIELGLVPSFGDERPLQRAFAHIVSANGSRMAGDLSGAWSSFREACDLAEADGLFSISHIARHGLAMIELLSARPDTALADLRVWFADERRRPYWRTAGGAFLHSAQARALMDLGRKAEAAVALDEAVALLERLGIYRFLGVALVQRARLHAIEDRLDEALADLARARESAMPNRIRCTLFQADLCEAWIRLRRGELGNPERLLSRALEVLVESGQSGGENVESWQLVHCDWLLAADRPKEAQALARVAEKTARAAGRIRQAIDFLLLRALALQSQTGGAAQSGACIAAARKLAKPGGVALPFQLLGSALTPVAAPAEPEHEVEMVGIATEIAAPQSNGLHQRETQILHLLEQGLRNKDIAARLFLSEETVKWYLKRLYDNFGVGNRVQLLACVRKLGLLLDAG
ncbi:MAG: LuxR C-terminal-related transcriptional regulator [Betaproteobacteria bacterium]